LLRLDRERRKEASEEYTDYQTAYPQYQSTFPHAFLCRPN